MAGAIITSSEENHSRVRKKHFSQILAQVEAGEEITIIHSGIPVARLVRMDEPKKRRELGLYRDSVWVADDSMHLCPAKFWLLLRERSPRRGPRAKAPGRSANC